MKKLPPSLWAPLLLLFAGEFRLFDQVGAHRHTWIYARWSDQVQYLGEAYEGWERVRLQGFVRGLWQTLIQPCAQGTLHAFLAVLSFTVAGGPSRSAALALNMLAMILWQAALAFAAWRRSGRPSLAWMAAALPLALAWPWNNGAGSAVDFRLDHLALCAMGTTLACAWLGDGFRSKGGAVAFGLAAGLTVLIRFITAAYLVPIFLVLLLPALAGTDRAARARRGLGAALIAALVAGPFLWLDRASIRSYYVIGHSTGAEAAARDPHMDFGTSVVWLVRVVARGHLGEAFGWIALAGTAALAGGALVHRCLQTTERPPPASEAALDLAFLGAVFALVPAIILARHRLKSDIVVGISAPGIIALLLAIWSALARACPAFWRGLCAGGIAAACVAFFVQRQCSPAYSPEFAAEARKVAALADTIYRRSREAGLAAPRVGIDQTTDSINPRSIKLLCYERHHEMVPFFMTLPLGIVAEPEPLLLDRVALSDFFFFTESGPVGPWPFDREMRELSPRVRAWCETHLRAVDRFRLNGQSMVLYQRKEIPVD